MTGEGTEPTAEEPDANATPQAGSLDFRVLFGILQAYLSDGRTEPKFLHDLLAVLAGCLEEEYGTAKDPTAGLKQDTIKHYLTVGISRSVAQRILNRYKSNQLAATINAHGEETLRMLAEDLRKHGVDADESDVAYQIEDMLVEIIRARATPRDTPRRNPEARKTTAHTPERTRIPSCTASPAETGYHEKSVQIPTERRGHSMAAISQGPSPATATGDAEDSKGRVAPAGAEPDRDSLRGSRPSQTFNIAGDLNYSENDRSKVININEINGNVSFS